MSEQLAGDQLDSETARARRLYDREADRFDKGMDFSERVLFGDGRRWICSQATGDTLEIALGTGRNLPFYPPEVQLTGIELSDAMLAIARRRADELKAHGAGAEIAELRQGDAQSLPFADASFDTVVCTLALCTIPDDRRAITEAYRVLRPGGRLLLLEHVRSPNPLVRTVERIIEPLSLRMQADHLTRDPVDYLHAMGFEIERLERAKWGFVERLRARKRD
ncbi:MAG: class I SAM-dependent methyltransferase [Ktedonobacterales bacterium]